MKGFCVFSANETWFHVGLNRMWEVCKRLTLTEISVDHRPIRVKACQNQDDESVNIDLVFPAAQFEAAAYRTVIMRLCKDWEEAWWRSIEFGTAA